MSASDEERELQEAISRSLQEKNNHSITEEQGYNKVLTESLLANEEEIRLQEALLLSQQNIPQTEEEKSIQENNSLKNENKILKEKIEYLNNQIFLQQIEIGNQAEELEREKRKNHELTKRLKELEQGKDQNELQTKKERLRRLIEKIRTVKMSENLGDDLEDFLETQEEVIKNNNNSYAQRQLKRYKNRLLEELTKEELEEISQLKTEIVKLEIQLENPTEQTEARILIPERKN